MAAPRETVWKLEPHTRAKHEILKRYLQAWMIILSQGRFPEILYVDGFAGPGEYAGGETGSPIIALDTALGYRPPLQAQVHFLFVEENAARAAHLQKQIALRTIPSNFHLVVEGGVTFETAFGKHYQQYVRGNRLIPTFAFIDPFGWTGAPFSLVKRILAHPSCEAFVNFMYEEINRFISHSDQVGNFTGFFGTEDWKRCVDVSDPRERNRCLHDLYLDQLHAEGGAAFVRSFEMSNARDVTDYFLFYAINNILGLKKMKEAMWKIDESGEFKFSDSTDPNQLILFEKAPNTSVLQSRLLAAFSGRTVSIADIEKFVVVETAFRETYYKKILKALEMDNGKLQIVSAAPGRKAGTFGDPTMLVRFTA
jgi:three-Cys-motif partner protein